ncbi:MAG: IS110 family transposase [Microthrixaceae bacterium]
MSTIAQPDVPCRVIGGVDTHKDQHVAAAIDHVGRLLAIAEFPATAAGYRQLHVWLADHGEIISVGIEGCGSWGAGLARHLAAAEVTVIEVNRPNRQTRRRRGKSDSVDAEAAARAVLNGDAKVVPKSGNGPVESLRQLRVARAGAVKARTAAANQLHSLLDTAPDRLRAQLTKLTFKQKVAMAERFRPGAESDTEASTKRALRSVARRWRFLQDEATELRAEAKKIIDEIAPELVARNGVGYETAGQLLVTAGDNPERLNSERSFAALCASTPVQASTGRTKRHRLNRGGDRQANSALWTIVLVRMGTDPRTKAYVEKRTADGLSKREIMRCLKRYVARELYPLIRDITGVHTPELEHESAA